MPGVCVAFAVAGRLSQRVIGVTSVAAGGDYVLALSSSQRWQGSVVKRQMRFGPAMTFR
jgi:hypothetical protein